MRSFITIIAAGTLSVVAGIAVVLFAAYGLPRYGGGKGLTPEPESVPQFVVPLVMVAVLQWLVLRTAPRRRAMAAP